MKYTLLCFANVALLVVGQLLFKLGVKDKNFDSAASIIKNMFSPAILSGITLYGFATILWLYILNKIPISRAHPIQALAYPVTLIIARFAFNETIPANRWIGIVIVFIGIIIMS